MTEPADHQLPPNQGTQVSALPLAGLRCLVLDDEFLIAFDIEQTLQAAGAAAVVCVSSAEAALAALQTGPPFALAVLDVLLGPNGESCTSVAEALTRLRTPFVLLTGFYEDDVRVPRFPAVPIVEKPYQTPQLIDALRKALVSR
jgi:CheY-like chemotaxis protein